MKTVMLTGPNTTEVLEVDTPWTGPTATHQCLQSRGAEGVG
jgi:hypothetical protein